MKNCKVKSIKKQVELVSRWAYELLSLWAVEWMNIVAIELKCLFSRMLERSPTKEPLMAIIPLGIFSDLDSCVCRNYFFVVLLSNVFLTCRKNGYDRCESYHGRRVSSIRFPFIFIRDVNTWYRYSEFGFVFKYILRNYAPSNCNALRCCFS